MMKQKMANDSQIVRADGNLSWVQVGPASNKYQAPTNGLNLYARADIESESWPIDMELKFKRNPQL